MIIFSNVRSFFAFFTSLTIVDHIPFGLLLFGPSSYKFTVKIRALACPVLAWYYTPPLLVFQRPPSLFSMIFRIFSIYVFFVAKPQKKTSIDGLKWRDLVMGRWWLANFKVSAVRCHKGFHVSNFARQASPCKRPRARG